jgi:hypothetical protein
MMSRDFCASHQNKLEVDFPRAGGLSFSGSLRRIIVYSALGLLVLADCSNGKSGVR